MSLVSFIPYAGKPSFSGTTDCPDELRLLLDRRAALRLMRLLIERVEWIEEHGDARYALSIFGTKVGTQKTQE